jgi:hypothetical protein
MPTQWGSAFHSFQAKGCIAAQPNFQFQKSLSDILRRKGSILKLSKNSKALTQNTDNTFKTICLEPVMSQAFPTFN